MAALFIAACGASVQSTTPTPGGGTPPRPITPGIPSATAGPVTSGEITVTLPFSGSEVSSPIRVEGTARVFEATVEFALKDAGGQVLAKGFTTATAGAPERGNFATTVSYKLTGSKQNGTLEVFSTSPRDGSVMNLVRIPVVLLPS